MMAESLSTLVEFETGLEEIVSETARNSTSPTHSHISQGDLLLNSDTSTLHDIGAVGNTLLQCKIMIGNNYCTCLISGFHADSSALEQVVTPFPQPVNGYTVSENSNSEQFPGFLMRKFCFPAGQIQVSHRYKD